jgi:PIN domain nuclease of toxin-antitoxin system
MEAVAHLDTHVVVWLYAGELERIPTDVRARLESDELFISPAVILELQYLFEIRRITEPAATVVADLKDRIGLSVSDVPFEKVATIATSLSWTRDPFDRLIVAQAQAHGATLLSADKLIRKHCTAASWGRVKRS